MKLGLNDYRNITLGCTTVAEEMGKIRFHRFTEQEELFYLSLPTLSDHTCFCNHTYMESKS